jgi:hypothetical protein
VNDLHINLNIDQTGERARQARRRVLDLLAAWAGGSETYVGELERKVRADIESRD